MAMTAPDLRNYGQTSMIRGSAISGTPLLPDVVNGNSNPREVRRALRDPVFARTFKHKLRIEALIYVILIECVLLVFFGIGYLVLH